MKVMIKEEDCIGCAKCLAYCPVDAIVGSNKMLHTVIQADCIGCQLCIPPCPVNCIEIIEEKLPQTKNLAHIRYLQDRYKKRKVRLKQQESLSFTLNADKKQYISEALKRLQQKNKG